MTDPLHTIKVRYEACDRIPDFYFYFIYLLLSDNEVCSAMFYTCFSVREHTQSLVRAPAISDMSGPQPLTRTDHPFVPEERDKKRNENDNRSRGERDGKFFFCSRRTEEWVSHVVSLEKAGQRELMKFIISSTEKFK